MEDGKPTQSLLVLVIAGHLEHWPNRKRVENMTIKNKWSSR